ncbi:MAG TPA: L-lactate dehydrogenase [Chloroflexota bacterium]|nr:L-lactate dehydrogenase [Chloroflexota bacterium]
MKISMIGAGRVGSTTLYTLLLGGDASEMVIVDIDKARAEGEALDLRHALSVTNNCKISSGDYDATEGSDMVIITAGIPRKPGDTRLDLLKKNTELMQGILDGVLKYNKDCFLFMVSNPVDVLTYQALKSSGFPTQRVFGLGTVLDTNRFRSLLGEWLGVSPDQVTAYMVGEHGDSMVPLLSRALVAGVPLAEFPGYSREKLDELVTATRFGGAEVIKRKGGTFYSVAPSIVSVVRAVIYDQKRVLPISSLIDGQYKELAGMTISLPTIVGKAGREKVLDPMFSQAEEADFRNSLRVLREAADSVGL